MALHKYFKKEGDCNSAFIIMREIKKADEKVKQVLDASDRNSCSGKLTPRCKYNAYTAGIRQIKILPNFDFSTSRTIRQIFCPQNFPVIRYIECATGNLHHRIELTDSFLLKYRDWTFTKIIAQGHN